MLGNCRFGSVHAAIFTNPRLRFKGYPPMVAVKSAYTTSSAELIMEKMLLDHLGQSPFIIRCFGEDVTVVDKDGKLMLNVFLEYASGGSLAGLIKKSKGLGLLGSQVRRYTREILGGLKLIHQKGFVHCDLKPANILLVSDHNVFVAKIAELGLAKSAKLSKKSNVRGTSLFLSPEAVIEKTQGQPSDIWALGCIVLGMLTGESPWDKRLRQHKLFHKIATERPVLPPWISKEAKDFLFKCFTRNPNERPTAEMLLSHPFVCQSEIKDGHFQNSEENLLSSSLSKADVEDTNFIPLGGASCEEVEVVSDGFASELSMPLALMYPRHKRPAISRPFCTKPLAFALLGAV